MDYRAAFTGRYLAAPDLRGRAATVVIERVDLQPVEDEQGNARDRLIVGLVGKKKAWVLNRTNAELIAAMFGPDTDEWIGHAVTIRAEKVQFGRERVDGLRVQGSPELPADREVEVKLPKKRPQKVTLRRTTTGAAGDSEVSDG